MHRISANLKAWMPDAKYFSVRGLKYMRLFVTLYRTQEIAQQPVAQLENAEMTQQLVAQTGIVATRRQEFALSVRLLPIITLNMLETRPSVPARFSPLLRCVLVGADVLGRPRCVEAT